MCTSYEAPGKIEFEAFSLFPMPSFDYRGEIYKDYAAPIFRRVDGKLSTDAATFGMVPRERIPPGVKVFDTMNARSETVDQKRSFSGAWNRLQLALIPCHRFYEPSYETGKPVRWRIGLADERACAIAGLWRAWENPDGSQTLSMTMLTLNADEHPLMKRFHKPGAEKRGVVVLPQAEHLRVAIVHEHGRSQVFPATAAGRRIACRALPASTTQARNIHSRRGRTTVPDLGIKKSPGF